MTEAVLPTVAVVVPTYQRAALLARALDGLARQTYPADRLEVVVVDDASTDDTTGVVAAWDPPFAHRFVRLADNQGAGPARNAGVAATTSELVAFTDSDCVADPDWLSQAVKALAPGVGVVQGRTVPIEPAESWHHTIQVDGLSGRFETCNVLYRREVLEATGGFPGGDLASWGEDVVVGWTALRTGCRAVFAPDAVVRHEVIDPGFGWWIARQAPRYHVWCGVARRVPEVRHELFWARIFLRPRDAALVAALVSGAAATRRRSLALGALPYLWMRRPSRLDRWAVRGAARSIVFDLATLWALVRGSVRHRSLVL